MEIGDKVQWESRNKVRTGVIHGIRRAEDEKGVEQVVGYLVDTGKALYVKETKNDKGKVTDRFVQPEMADLTPDQVSPAE